MLGGFRAREPSPPEPTPDLEAKPTDEPVESPPQLMPIISEGAAPIATFEIEDGATLGPLLPKARMVVLATVLMMTVFVEVRTLLVFLGCLTDLADSGQHGADIAHPAHGSRS
jgi:hypothetical protein